VQESSGDVNWPIDGPCGERLPAVDLTLEIAPRSAAAVVRSGVQSWKWPYGRFIESACGTPKRAKGLAENGGRTAGGKAGVLRRDRSTDQRLALRRFLDFFAKALREAIFL
jgi:hypothetical protein